MSPHFARMDAAGGKRTKGESLSGGWGLRPAVVVLASLWTLGAALAHPHVWVTVQSRLLFAPDGKLEALTHDWVFDEMYSSFAVQGLSKPGSLVKRADFAPLARENAGSLAEAGYFTTLRIGGKAVDFGTVSDYWMEERPDHLVQFHVTIPLKTPVPLGKLATLRVADPEFFVDFEFDDKAPVTLVSPPDGCSASVARPQPLAPGDKQKLTESFFTNLAPGTNFGFKMASTAILACP